MKEKFTIEEKIAVIDRHIVMLKTKWAPQLSRDQEYALHHLAVMKAIAEGLREDLRANA
jgi:kynurenine formamidase